MTGMKEGAGEDPFAEDPSPTEPDPVTSDSTPQPDEEDTRTTTSAGADTETGDASERRTRREQQSMQIPYKLRRDSVQDGRDRVPLFLQEDTKRAERDALRELEERFDENVSLTDLREALVKVGLQHLDETEMELEEWGYGMTFDV